MPKIEYEGKARKKKGTKAPTDSKEYLTDWSKPLPNGLRIWVHREGHWLPANVLEKKARPDDPHAAAAAASNRGRKRTHGEMEDTVDDSGALPPGADPVREHRFVYYIHYKDWDRRMDEWITRDRISLQQPPVYPAHMAAMGYPPAAAAAAAAAGAGAAPLFESKDGVVMSHMPADPMGKAKLLGKAKSKSHTHDKDDPLAAIHGHGNMTAEDIRQHEEATKVKNIDSIILGKFDIHTWYYSPIPEEYNKYRKLFFCEFCLTFFGHPLELERHMKKCKLRHPPGNEIYRSDEQNVTVCVFEVDGAKETVYCQNLCYIAKFFLDHKTLEYDCNIFLFYILCEVSPRGCHIVGYFSKEKAWFLTHSYNLACILTLPCHQRKGYGKFLISLSYELGKIEGRCGSPEKPISDLGMVSYMSYWTGVLCKLLKEKNIGDEMSLEEIANQTRMTTLDVTETLKALNILVWYKGKWVFSKTQLDIVAAEKEAAIAKEGADPTSVYVAPCRPEKLHWTPYVLDRKAGY